MKQMAKGWHFTERQKWEMAQRCFNGESFVSVARDFDCSVGNVSRIFQKRGGKRRAPLPSFQISAARGAFAIQRLNEMMAELKLARSAS